MVLLASLRLGPDEAYAVSIVDEIEARTSRVVQRAARAYLRGLPESPRTVRFDTPNRLARVL